MTTGISWSFLLLCVGKGEQKSCLCHIWLWDMRPFHGPSFDDELGLRAAHTPPWRWEHDHWSNAVIPGKKWGRNDQKELIDMPEHPPSGPQKKTDV